MNWCRCAILPWKKVVLILLHQKKLCLAVMGKYHSKFFMLFNLDFFKFSTVLNFIKTDSGMTSAVLNIAEKCLNVTAVRPITSWEESFIVL